MYIKIVPKWSWIERLVAVRVVMQVSAKGGVLHSLKGVAICSPSDYFDAIVGYRIAVAHAVFWDGWPMRKAVWEVASAEIVACLKEHRTPLTRESVV